MQDFGLVLDPRFEDHDTGPGHPERPARLAGVRAVLAETAAACTVVEPVPADDRLLERVHDPEHLRRVAQVCAQAPCALGEPDTIVGPASAEIARLAAGSVVALCREVAAGRLRAGFAAVRPPGHHAERDRAMGFCLFNNVAVAAADLRASGCERVLVFDWDVHHGNGTQHIFEEDSGVFYVSVHQSPLYPGTGAASETGRGDGAGTTRNFPLPPGAGDDAFLGAIRDGLAPVIRDYRPEFLLISAGFDAHRNDPLAQLTVSTEAYADASRRVRGLAEEVCGGRIVSVLEGGYDLEALSASVLAHLGPLL